MPVDQTLHWADPLGTGPLFTQYTGPVPLTTHVHGALVEPESDGGPETWYTPGYAIKGPHATKEVYEYNNQQLPATIWYHDHGFGVDRLNVYMGLAGYYLITDPEFEAPLNLPSAPYDMGICIQDRMFNTGGSFLYPGNGINPDIHPFWIPEFFGDVMLANGKVWPYLNVEPRKYRFRFLNGCNARFLELRLFDRVNYVPGPAFYQIGTDGGYLAAPVMLNDPTSPKAPRLLFAPGERCDVIIDFAGLAVGTKLTLVNSAKAPYPNGTAPNPMTTGQIMEFRVIPLSAPDESSIPSSITTIPTLTPGPVTRTLTLNEVEGPLGPLAALLDGRTWHHPITEMPILGSTEIWEIVNLTADAHPIHLHGVQFQLLNRQMFNRTKYLKVYNKLNPIIPIPEDATYTTVLPGPYLQGPAMPPDPNEAGWKDTFRMNPGQVTRAIIRFAFQDGSPYADVFDATAEPGYVWHCHILEHEENDMMRPFKMVAEPSFVAGNNITPATFPESDQSSFSRLAIYPNPFNLTAVISYNLPATSQVSLNVYNIMGQKVKTLVDAFEAAGNKTVTWNGTNQSGENVASGLYFLRLETASGTAVKRATLLK